MHHVTDRAESLKVGFYSSLIDWHYPDYTIDRVHPQRQEKDEYYEKKEFPFSTIC